uniref:RING-type E3 ubiquitin transferase n=1 Tax=Aquila chrysaetos chrysaetos TaxID=223781 RepID=A0A663EUJ6_AQUCH
MQSSGTVNMGSGSTSLVPPSPPQHMESVAMEPEDHCPICLCSWEEASFVMPCLHRFCYPCILRWAESKPECPLCKRRILSILHSVRADDDYVEHIITPPSGVVRQEYVVGLPARLRRTMAMERARGQSLQRRYNLRPRPATSQPSAGRSRPAGTDGSSCSPSASASSVSNKHHDVLQDACVFRDQRATRRRECFPTLSGQCGKAKGEEGFPGCAVMSFHPSAAAGDASLALSQPPAPKQQGRAAQESLAGSPGNPLLRPQGSMSAGQS